MLVTSSRTSYCSQDGWLVRKARPRVVAVPSQGLGLRGLTLASPRLVDRKLQSDQGTAGGGVRREAIRLGVAVTVRPWHLNRYIY